MCVCICWKSYLWVHSDSINIIQKFSDLAPPQSQAMTVNWIYCKCLNLPTAYHNVHNAASFVSTFALSAFHIMLFGHAPSPGSHMPADVWYYICEMSSLCILAWHKSFSSLWFRLSLATKHWWCLEKFRHKSNVVSFRKRSVAHKNYVFRFRKWRGIQAGRELSPGLKSCVFPT